ncbi:uncharacterized protein LOC122519503 isoform X1 [Polistes fuscatus]|uniref:uncharacterized protein LOC122519503 isoform X1 n=1 Tax=Polistes fuscatus TaxID=30207 RepID=UPI001CA87159|nr:uncharacterized protein LOC122519503 isoform X1 [Polistes fuscatus]XP_043494919.1 uncharacterized protein LOC122519503 isoform X1 [Polistes fuscatus]XP_043494920.1 uncharacterized protein LOC122519503 isoform X1 [Polistes fuscatus]XP_043494921.1 uncharacterized protein LOC122519503 isoform X1 [Polistes fuscatus]XP_043494922.1 uncharacterized protein LOC122519503 isoform X1 [Polistes fuscatus]XP_043494923.1 uncharacterized protein LOC122519503 isoform X1 [Polistes fuscatus]XP_043494924.1 un
MLGVLKRRWKPSKRASSGRGTDSPLNSDLALDKPRPIPSPRQIHPLYGEKAGLLGYCDTVGNTENFPPAPNIVVEGGRIEFVRPSQDGTTIPRRNTMSRGSQTFNDQSEKSDPAKESLEERVHELERALQAERLVSQRDRATITKLQRQINKREATQRDVERERRQRLEAEARLREATAEAERARSRVHHLQRELARMEESSRGLLQHKQRAEQLKQEKTALTLSYEARVHQYQVQISKLQLENESMRGQLRGLEAACAGEVHAALVARLATLESEHAALARDADAQRRQYERCLDDVANQVVRALLSQKGFREEIGALQRRIRELEAQNRALSGLLAQAASPGSPTELIQNILEAGPAALVAALSLDPSWVPLSRPRSLNLQIPVMAAATKCRRNRPTLGQKPSTGSGSASNGTTGGAEEEGSESPESGNRDEGYSTMSSDVQGEGARQEPSSRGLEDLKEATDETEGDVSPDARLIALDAGDPDVLFLPLNLTVGINPRHSYPPSKDLLPYQHVMRSFSDSHLCLKLTATSNFTPYKLPSPMGSSSLLLIEEEGWDAEYVQQWLRLDDSRSAQQHRDLLELEYDRAELEDWSFSLSTEDLVQTESTTWKESNACTAIPALPAIKEHNPLELEEDANECLWNGASYLADRAGGELVALLMDTRTAGPWPYASSPGASWSSEEGVMENSSKRSSAALSGCSDDPDSPSIGTDFTRDFYRLVKFESTKSLASTSSRSGKPPTDREQALQSVLSFIAEQQMYLAELPSNSSEQNDTQAPPTTHSIEENAGNRSECPTVEGASIKETERSPSSQESAHSEHLIEVSNNEDDPLEQIAVPSLQTEDRILGVIGSNSLGAVGYTTVAPTELVAVPEEDEEAATSSTPSTVVSPARAPLLVEGRDRSLSFHERATSKDVIDELNRMIRKGEDSTVSQDPQVALEKLDLACCCPTGWVHVERDIDFTDPKARANLLDVMLASSESSSATSSSGSAGSDSGDEPPDYRHLHRLHRYRRQKKASAAQAQRVLRPSTWGTSRPSIIDRGEDFFVRYGEKEREAVASFDFLDEMVPSSSACSDDVASEHGGSSDNKLDVVVVVAATNATPVTDLDNKILQTSNTMTLTTTTTTNSLEIDELTKQPHHLNEEEHSL